jgi:diadenosine tetraphosphate (Ap4A) HIT family hydrolase
LRGDLKRHVPDLHELQAPELQGFVADIALVGRAVSQAFAPVKIDTLMYGHLCPHLHCHVLPQYRDDDPRANPDINAGELVLAPAEQQARVRMLGERLRELAAAG